MRLKYCVMSFWPAEGAGLICCPSGLSDRRVSELPELAGACARPIAEDGAGVLLTIIGDSSAVLLSDVMLLADLCVSSSVLGSAAGN